MPENAAREAALLICIFTRMRLMGSLQRMKC